MNKHIFLSLYPQSFIFIVPSSFSSATYFINHHQLLPSSLTFFFFFFFWKSLILNFYMLVPFFCFLISHASLILSRFKMQKQSQTLFQAFLTFMSVQFPNSTCSFTRFYLLRSPHLLVFSIYAVLVYWCLVSTQSSFIGV